MNEIETSENWDKILKSYVGATAEQLKQNKATLLGHILSERTKLALTAIRACSVIEKGAMADYILPSLIKVTEKTNKVMVHAAHDMALITAQKGQHIPHPFLSEQLKNPSKTARFTVFSCFIVVSPQLDVPTLEKTIKSAILDSSGQIRDCARTLFATYQELHPQALQKFVHSLDETSKKYLNVAAMYSHTSTGNVSGPNAFISTSAGSMSNTSLKSTKPIVKTPTKQKQPNSDTTTNNSASRNCTGSKSANSPIILKPPSSPTPTIPVHYTGLGGPKKGTIEQKIATKPILSHFKATKAIRQPIINDEVQEVLLPVKRPILRRSISSTLLRSKKEESIPTTVEKAEIILRNSKTLQKLTVAPKSAIPSLVKKPKASSLRGPLTTASKGKAINKLSTTDKVSVIVEEIKYVEKDDTVDTVKQFLDMVIDDAFQIVLSNHNLDAESDILQASQINDTESIICDYIDENDTPLQNTPTALSPMKKAAFSSETLVDYENFDFTDMELCKVVEYLNDENAMIRMRSFAYCKDKLAQVVELLKDDLLGDLKIKILESML